MTIHALAVVQLLQPLNEFVKGHFYMTVEWTQEYYEKYYGNYIPGEPTKSKNFNAVHDLLKRHPNEFKLVYESPAFLNTTHYSNRIPYLKLFIVEKL